MTAEKDVQVARKKGRGGEVIWAMPERKHSFLNEVFPNTIYIPYNIYNTKYIYNTIYTLQYIYNTISIWPLTQYMKRRKHDKDYKMLSHIKCAVFLKVFQKCHNFNKRTFFKFNVAVTE